MENAKLVHNVAMRFLFGTFFIIALVASSLAYADTRLGVCEDYLTSSRYQLSRVFGDREPIWALNPELGSIEDERPGTVADLMRIRYDFKNKTRELMALGPVAPDQVIKALDRVNSRLVTLQLRHAEPRLRMLVERVLPYLKRVQSLATTNTFDDITVKTVSKIWELTLACFFDGEEIHLGERVADLFPHEYQTAKGRAKFHISVRPEWLREIDIAVKKWDGSWHWVEVKDWSPLSAAKYVRSGVVEHQSSGQNYSRYILRAHDIEMSLVLKFGVSEDELNHYRDDSYFDNILFAFPQGDHHVK